MMQKDPNFNNALYDALQQLDAELEREKQNAEKVDALINSLGGMAEMLGVYRDGLMHNGFTRREAIELCNDMVRSMMGR